jgi:DUF4097 and DUF4098 domain-containing protein YvlB
MKKATPIIVLIVALVLVCTGIGAVLWFSFGSLAPYGLSFDLNQVSASEDETQTVPPSGVNRLKVENDAGNVRITGGDVTRITIAIHKTGYGRDQTQAELELKEIQYEIVREGDTLMVRYKITNQDRMAVNNPNTVDFIITVPQEIETTVDVSFGRVELSDTLGAADLKSKFGDITVENLEGALSVATESGRVVATSITAGTGTIGLSSGFGDVSLENASAGKVTLESQSGALDLTNVRASGSVEMTTDFGNIGIDGGSAGPLTLTTESGKIDLTSLRVNGLLKANSNFGDINLEKVAARSYDVETASGSVTIDEVQAPVRAHTNFGNITVTNAVNVTLDLDTQSGSIEFEGSLGEGSHGLHSDFGEIRLSVPADSALNVDLQTDFGRITSDLPITVVLSGEIEPSHQVGTLNGGGALLTVSTNSGGISIMALKE